MPYTNNYTIISKRKINDKKVIYPTTFTKVRTLRPTFQVLPPTCIIQITETLNFTINYSFQSVLWITFNCFHWIPVRAIVVQIYPMSLMCLYIHISKLLNHSPFICIKLSFKYRLLTFPNQLANVNKLFNKLKHPPSILIEKAFSISNDNMRASERIS